MECIGSYCLEPLREGQGCKGRLRKSTVADCTEGRWECYPGYSEPAERIVAYRREPLGQGYSGYFCVKEGVCSYRMKRRGEGDRREVGILECSLSYAFDAVRECKRCYLRAQERIVAYLTERGRESQLFEVGFIERIVSYHLDAVGDYKVFKVCAPLK